MPATSSRIIAALANLTWVPVLLILLFPPEGDGATVKFFESFVRQMYNTPKLTLLLGLAAVWRPFERGHWSQALLVSFIHSAVSLLIVVLALLFSFPGPGAMLAVLIFYVVLPAWLFLGWTTQLGFAIFALCGGPSLPEAFLTFYLRPEHSA